MSGVACFSQGEPVFKLTRRAAVTSFPTRTAPAYGVPIQAPTVADSRAVTV